jgi:hypothetical protein
MASIVDPVKQCLPIDATVRGMMIFKFVNVESPRKVTRVS